MQKRSNLIVMTLRKLSVLPHIIILDSVTSCVPISVIETVYSEVPFEREQLASSNVVSMVIHEKLRNWVIYQTQLY